MREPLAHEEHLDHRLYADRAKAISDKSNAEIGRINRHAAALGVLSFIIIFAAGFIGAAIVDRGHSNLKQWVVSNEPV